MVPETELGVRTVAPYKKAPHLSTAKAIMGDRSACSEAVVISKAKNKAEWRGPCCGGTHFWGHGEGHKSKFAGGSRYWVCGQCKQLLKEKLTDEEQLERAAELAEQDLAWYM